MWIDDFYFKLPNTFVSLNFISFYYLLFILVSFYLNYLFKAKFKVFFLTILNTIFIFSFGYSNFIYLILVFLYTYLISKFINKKTILYLSIIPIILLLIFFKYYNLFDTSLSIAMPLGLSFYSFKAISYLVDVYRNKVERETNFIYLYNYLAFFATIIAGPINRYQPFKDNLKEKLKLDYFKARNGFQLLLLGIFEKMVICDFIGQLVNLIEGHQELKGLNILLMVVLYSLQIYLDFDALSNIAIGSGQILGFNLPDNFKTPYLATSIKDFWHRWHISLSTWFKDYVYIPLGGSRKGRFKTCVNILIVFSLSGLWHGNSLNFLWWGLFHGFIQVIENIVLLPFKQFTLPKIFKLSLKPFLILLNFSLVSISWLFFKYQSFDQIRALYTRFLSPQALNLNLIMTHNEIIWLVVLLVFVLIFEVLRYHFKLLELFNKLPLVFRWFIYFILIYVFLVFGVYGGSFDANDFIYRWF